jgi:ADP-heptose:LPS heptosyltransferase
MLIHTDCRKYRGDAPCKPHKEHGAHCPGCLHYDPGRKRILIIKLGAIGDVIRTTPLLRRLKSEFPAALVHWLTHTPEVLPSVVDRSFRFIPEHLEILKATHYDLVLNLDKDREACGLANAIKSGRKRGFRLQDGNCHPIGKAARLKWLTGLFDDENRRNQKSYPEEIFAMAGYRFQGEEYMLEAREKNDWKLDRGKPVIGLNTGCGRRWATRLWPESHWKQLSLLLKKQGYEVVFLGGEQEHEKNARLAKLTKARYFGHFKLETFIDLLNQCDLVVTSVTMALHLALGLKKKIVLFNNIFNPHEFELYGRGVILEPGNPCQCCFRNECDLPCMEKIMPDRVLKTVISLIDAKS